MERLCVGVGEGWIRDGAIGEYDQARVVVPVEDIAVEREQRGDVLERREGRH